MTTTARDREHDFTLILTGIGELTEEAEDALFEAGCDDATLSVRGGVVSLRFSRVAPMLKDAILGAIRDVRRAGLGADVLRVDTRDLVTRSDIARRIGRSRQLVHQYINGIRGPGDFPSATGDRVEGPSLWDWCEVAGWLRQNNLIKEEDLLDARQVAVINSVLDLRHREKLDPELTEEVLAVFRPSP